LKKKNEKKKKKEEGEEEEEEEEKALIQNVGNFLADHVVFPEDCSKHRTCVTSNLTHRFEVELVLSSSRTLGYIYIYI
jgi:hypothetical protein